MASKERTVVCFGTGPVFKGGMSNYNTSLAKALSQFENVKVHIVSWSKQYPSIVPREFKDTVSALDFLEGYNISVSYKLNYNNPLSWTQTAKYIASLEPDQVLIQWSIALQGLPIGAMVKKLKKLCRCEVILDLHFVIQKEESNLDRRFTKMGIRHADTYIVHSLQTYRELQEIFPNKSFHLTESGERDKDKTTVLKLFHPIYDLYQADPNFDVQAFKDKHGLSEKVFLFFGFIRKYKGLHHAIEAFKLVADQREEVSFLICGELFWNTLAPGNFLTKFKKSLFGIAKRIFLSSKEDEGQYNPLSLINELGLQDRTMVVSEYIPNEDVSTYFQVADSVILFYSTATPSGIESLSYNFDLPILATRVGHFPETIEDGKNGYMVEENSIESMAATMMRFLDAPIPPSNVNKYKENLSWEVYAKAVLGSEKQEARDEKLS